MSNPEKQPEDLQREVVLGRSPYLRAFLTDMAFDPFSTMGWVMDVSKAREKVHERIGANHGEDWVQELILPELPHLEGQFHPAIGEEVAGGLVVEIFGLGYEIASVEDAPLFAGRVGGQIDMMMRGNPQAEWSEVGIPSIAKNAVERLLLVGARQAIGVSHRGESGMPRQVEDFLGGLEA